MLFLFAVLRDILVLSFNVTHHLTYVFIKKSFTYIKHVTQRVKNPGELFAQRGTAVLRHDMSPSWTDLIVKKSYKAFLPSVLIFSRIFDSLKTIAGA